ncbi:hypothetical protein EYZ11_005950 [Aspergillus tanneri]|uniref:Uncharacterized protein n=1 Tax=Aspergillus tanneri TaxID=1220188 RepID=A0A4S3JMK6_9EURO|nr:uncharacterized protein ATNIH1004_002266 [Aspergillus tanneri]KAA8649595.1 hypothetical protein ATNIH1004_002266 [Aspergillus tanneri]THC94551.1 hypothetical protein EYZ11_005950 [Aspergillus tanneri]
MSLVHLPNEILLFITERLQRPRDINAPSQVTHRLYTIVNLHLYRHNVRFGHSTPLQWATRHGLVSTARKLLDEGAALNACAGSSWKPLALAAKYSHEEIVRILLEKGFDPRPTTGWTGETRILGTPLSLAVGNGYESVARLLIAHGAT